MSKEKDIKDQINEYHKLIKELKAENIPLSDEFVAGILIENCLNHGMITKIS
jgi:hypothetical protein